MRAIVPVLSQHHEQCSLLWDLRRKAVGSPNYSLEELARLDRSVQANIDGLLIGGDEGWLLSTVELSREEPCEGFVAGVLAFDSVDMGRVQLALSIAAQKPELAPGFISALGWLEAEHQIETLCASDSSTLRRIGVAASAIQRRDPGRPLTDALSDPDPLLSGRALRAIGELGRSDPEQFQQNALNGETGARRFWAAWSTVLRFGDRRGLETLRVIVQSRDPFRERALQLACRVIDVHSAGLWIKELAGESENARVAVCGAAVTGDSALIPWLIDQMRTPALARVAGEAFTMITGVDLAFQDLDADQPEGFEAGPTEDPADENVEMDPDENLPWPNPELIAKWWLQHQHEFQNGTRYLLGRPITVEWCEQVLREGRQRQRAAAALEIAIRRPGQPLFNVAAPGFRQQEMLGIRRWPRRS